MSSMSSTSNFFSWFFGNSSSQEVQQSSNNCSTDSPDTKISNKDECCSSVSQKIDEAMYALMFAPPKRDFMFFRSLEDDPFLNLHSTLNLNNQHTVSMLFATPVPTEKFEITKNTKCFVLSHGNASDIFSYAPYVKKMAHTYNMLFVVYDYPGYGISEGAPTEDSCLETLDIVINYLCKSGIDKKNMILMGQSIGTGVTANYAATHDWTRPIILISPYESIISVVCYSSMGIPNDKFKTYATTENMKCPVKIIHGDCDTVIDIKHGKSLYKRFGKKAMKPLWLKGIGHCDILDAIPKEEIQEVIDYP